MTWLYIVGGVVVVLGFTAFFGAPYVPSRRRDVRRLFMNDYPLRSDDVVLELGSGDGTVLRVIRQAGARAIGYELHPLLYWVSKVLTPGVQIRMVNIWTAPFPKDVTVVYIFSVGRDGNRLVRKMQREVARLGRTVTLICYGNPLPGRAPDSAAGPYLLYRFRPLHLNKP